MQMGGAIGQMVSGWFPCTPRERQSLVAAGAGAGLAAAFNAPLSGPRVRARRAPARLRADRFHRRADRVGHGRRRHAVAHRPLPVFHVETHATPSLAALPAALVIGAVAGLLGVAFNRGLVRSLDLFDGCARGRPGRWSRHRRRDRARRLARSGGARRRRPLVERTLAGEVGLSAIAPLFVVRFALDDGELRVRRAGRHLHAAPGARRADRPRAGTVAHRWRPRRSTPGRVRGGRNGRLLHGDRTRPAHRHRADGRDDRRLRARAAAAHWRRLMGVRHRRSPWAIARFYRSAARAGSPARQESLPGARRICLLGDLSHRRRCAVRRPSASAIAPPPGASSSPSSGTV